jgi:hypothetical protein
MDQHEEAKPALAWVAIEEDLQKSDIFSPINFGARRAFREVCPKHQNIRRETCGCDV